MKAKVKHEIQEYCSLLRLNAISEHFEEAAANSTDYEGFLHQLLRMEVDAEEERAKERKIKAAKFPYRKYIEDLEIGIVNISAVCKPPKSLKRPITVFPPLVFYML